MLPESIFTALIAVGDQIWKIEAFAIFLIQLLQLAMCVKTGNSTCELLIIVVS